MSELPEITPELIARMTPEQLAEMDSLIPPQPIWTPNPGPQTEGRKSKADILGLGGAAGGGKSYFSCGMASEHQRSAIFRQTGTELTAIIDELAGLFGTRKGFNGQTKVWSFTRYDGVPGQIKLGSFPHPGDEAKYQGNPSDLLVFEEAANMRESAVRFLMGWLRTPDPNQRCRVVMTFNPPTTVEGFWIVRFFGPWLDKKHPNPAKPGELRWFAVNERGKDIEVDGPEPVTLDDGTVVEPMSRTFIPAKVKDNPFYANTNYERTLMSLPEPLRSKMWKGDFAAGIEDDRWQVIRTDHVEAAMARWKRPDKLAPMDAVGVDVAMRGKDQTAIARRHGMWFDEPVVHPGVVCTDGHTVAGLVVRELRDRAPVHVDAFGVGAKASTALAQLGVQTVACDVGEPARGLAEDSRLEFRNWRSELWWRMREALDPANNTGICLPDDPELLRDLCTPKWKLVGNKIQVQSRDEIIENLGRSPDVGTAYVLALIDTPKTDVLEAFHEAGPDDFNPFDGY